MQSNVKNDVGQDFNILVNYCLELPFSFALWKDQADFVLISSKMQSLLKVPSLMVASLDFVKSISGLFGNFLYDAVEKITVAQFTNRKYSTNVNTKYNKDYTVSLYYNVRSNVYTLTVTDYNTMNKNPDFEADKKTITLLNEKITIFQEILDNLPLYVWQKNKSSKLLYCNKGYADVQSMSVSDVISSNKHLFKLPAVPSQPSSVQQLSASFMLHNEEKKMNVTEFISHANNNYVIGFATESFDKSTIEKGEIYRNQLLSIISHIYEGIAVFDVNNKIIFCNEVASQLFNLTPAKIEDKTYSEIIDLLLSNETIGCNNKDYRTTLLDIIKDVGEEPLLRTVQLTSGKNIRVSITTNKDKSLLFLFNDITTSLSKEREIHSIKSVYQSIMNNSNEGIIIFGSDNRIKSTNTTVHNIIKLPSSELTDIHIKTCFNEVNFENENIKNRFIDSLLKSADARLAKSEVINLFAKTVEWMYVPLPDGFNLLKFRDISSFKSMETKLKTASEQVGQIANLKSNLVTTIAEEYIAPLNNIMSSAEILNNKYFGELNEKQGKYCNNIINVAGYLKDIAEAITDIALILTDQMNLKFCETNINEFIQSVLDELKNVASNVNIKFEACEPSLVGYIDTEAIRKSIRNVILLSVYKIEKNSDILIKTYIESEDTGIFVIEIIDHSVILSDDEIKTYSQCLIKEISIGDLKTIDIGYTFAKAIIKKHYGKMTIHSVEDGTAIKFQLQIHQFLS